MNCQSMSGCSVGRLCSRISKVLRSISSMVSPQSISKRLSDPYKRLRFCRQLERPAVVGPRHREGHVAVHERGRDTGHADAVVPRPFFPLKTTHAASTSCTTCRRPAASVTTTDENPAPPCRPDQAPGAAFPNDRAGEFVERDEGRVRAAAVQISRSTTI